MSRIQSHVFPQRIRAKEFFKDYDHLKHGRVTSTQFVRAVALMGVSLSPAEAEALADHFVEQGVPKPQNVNYSVFCESVDGVFHTPRLEKSPGLKVPPVGHCVTTSFIHKEVEDQEKLGAVLHRIALLVRTRGIVLKYMCQDFERSDATSLTVPRRSGKVTVEQFCRCFPFLKDLSKDDLLLLIDRYSTPGGDIHFQQMHDDISEQMSSDPPPFPKSDLILRPDNGNWSQKAMTAVQKVQAKVVERRVRLREHFQDFDPLRKGFCSIGQVKSVFSLLKITVDTEVFDELTACYTHEDGMFCFRDFCHDIDQAFTCANLESNPLVRIDMPSAATTLPARRNCMSLTPFEEEIIASVEDKIRARTGRRGILLRSAFQDFDAGRRDHVTKAQFGRVMHSLGFELDEPSCNVLSKKYCDLGNHIDFNYSDFCKSCDPPTASEALAMEQTMQPHEPVRPSHYFNERGHVASLQQ
jgi:Ca2+-binding EF-hand superfamily protein